MKEKIIFIGLIFFVGFNIQAAEQKPYSYVKKFEADVTKGPPPGSDEHKTQSIEFIKNQLRSKCEIDESQKPHCVNLLTPRKMVTNDIRCFVPVKFCRQSKCIDSWYEDPANGNCYWGRKTTEPKYEEDLSGSDTVD